MANPTENGVKLSYKLTERNAFLLLQKNVRVARFLLFVCLFDVV